MPRAPLTPTFIRAIKKPDAGRVDYPDGATPGLNLRVSADDSWVWTLRMRDQAGELRRFTLGPMTDKQGLKWARDEAEALRQKVRREGRDPHRERRQAAAAAQAKAERDRLTLEVLVGDWQRMHLANRSPRYAAEAGRALRHAFAGQWGKPAAELDRATVVRVLDGLQRPARGTDDKAGASTPRHAIAARTAAYGRACYAWAMKRDTVPSNPFDALPLPAPAPARERVLSDDELKAVWTAAGKASDPFGSLVRMLILTGQRREEVAGMRWEHLSDDLTLWTIPGSETKNGKPHLVPLTADAQTIIAAREPPAGEPRAGLVFVGRVGTQFSGWSKCKADLDKDSSVTEWRIHDLRRTLATSLQRLGVRLEVTEAVLNHISGSRAGLVGVYQRHDWRDEKATALAAWAAHVRGLLADKAEPGNVVRLPVAQAG
jgi:integrase